MRRCDTRKDINDMVHSQRSLNNAIECSDHISRLAGMCLSINQDTGYEFEIEYSKCENKALPWDIEIYNQKTKMQLFTNKDFPEWLPKNDDSTN